MAISSGQPPLPEDQPNRDLGFGSVLSRERGLRLLNRDGSFNVFRHRPALWRRLTSYHTLLAMSWPQFFAVVVCVFLGLNTAFALAYYLAGPGSVTGTVGVETPFLRCFFFSVDTFATIGYGNLSPAGVLAHAIVTVEALFGMLTFALLTGLVFARFARPTAHIIYSRHAIIAPYREITGFEFRIINGRDNQLIDVEARVVLTRFEDANGAPQRRYYQLALERDRVAFFPLAWTVVHPINESSPLFGWTRDQLIEARAEFLILLTATDETFAQSVQSRSSYAAQEVQWDVRFANLFQTGPDVPTIDMHRFHKVERAE